MARSKILTLFFLQAIFSSPTVAEPLQPEKMLKIEYVNKSSWIPADSFAAKPHTVWRAGTAYMTLAEPPDFEHGIHGLMIVSEPDMWMVNLFTRSTKHLVDPGPTFIVHAQIFQASENKALQTLEFGREIEFFVKNSAKKQEQENQINYELDLENTHLSLTVNKKTNFPTSLEMSEGGRTYPLEYLAFDDKLKFDSAIFKVPAGIKTEENNQAKPALKNLKNAWMEQFLTHYYEHPEPARVSASLKAIKEDGMLDNFYSLIGFFGPVMKDNPNMLDTWAADAKELGSDMQQFIYFSLQECGSDACLKTLKKNPFGFDPIGIEVFAKFKPLNEKTIPLNSPMSLDFLWANFLATGSELPVKRIVQFVGEKEADFESKKLSTQELMVVGSARWSLISNARQHKKVLKVLQKESVGSTALRNVLVSAKEEHKHEH